MATHEWLVALRGSSALLESLTAIFPVGDPSFHGATMKSRHLNEIDDPDVVYNESELLLARAAAIANLYVHRTGDISVDNVLCFSCERRHGTAGHFEAAILVVSASEDVRIAHDVAELAGGLAPSLVNLAANDDRVAEVLATVGSAHPQWAAIYTAFEAMARDLKHVTPGKSAQWDILAERGWASSKLLENIKQTSNSYRHARGYPLPPRPVSIDEARSAMKAVARKWLNEKLAPKHSPASPTKSTGGI